MAGPILVVDDHADTREVLRDLLEGEGYAVVSAADGIEALAQVARTTPALVLLDLRMPGMRGPEVYATLHAQNPMLPVVYMSVEDTVRADAQRDRVAGYVLKPFDPDVLVRLIARLVG